MQAAASHGAEAAILRDVLVFLVAGLIAVPLFSRLRASPVLGYLLAGVAIGPAGIGLIRSDQGTQALAELGIVFLLFTIGLELSLERLRAMARYVFGLGFLQVLLTSAALAGLSYRLYPDPATALVLGGALALSSTAVVLRLLEERRELSTPYGRAGIAVLLWQDLAVVPLLAVLPLLAADGSALAALGEAAVRAALAVGGILLTGRLLLRPLFRLVAGTGSPELFAGMTLLAILATAWGAAQAGLSMALGAFLAGLLLAETEFRHQIGTDIAPFRGLLLGLFFITVGMSIDLAAVGRQLGPVVAAVVLLMLLKAAIVTALARAFRLPPTMALRLGVLLAQGSEFAFVVFALAVRHELLAPEIAQLAVAAVGISMALTPPLHAGAARLARRLEAVRPPETERLSETARGLHDHVVIAGFGRVGQTVAALLTRQGLPFVALDLEIGRVTEGVERGLPVFFGDGRRPEMLEAAGAGRARCVVVTLDNPVAAAQVVTALRRAHPELHVVVRARDPAHARRLEAAGASVVVPEMLEASLQLSALVLQSTGMSAPEAASIVDSVRREQYAAVAAPLLPAGRGKGADEA